MESTDSLFELVFFVLLLVGWILKSIAEQRRRQAPKPPPPHPGETGPSSGPEAEPPLPVPPRQRGSGFPGPRPVPPRPVPPRPVPPPPVPPRPVPPQPVPLPRSHAGKALPPPPGAKGHPPLQGHTALETDALVHVRPHVSHLRTISPFAVTAPGTRLTVAPGLAPHERAGQAATRLREARQAAIGRLTGGRSIPWGPDLVRAGILWSEVLGPPRALRGAYRTVTSRRHDR